MMIELVRIGAILVAAAVVFGVVNVIVDIRVTGQRWRPWMRSPRRRAQLVRELVSLVEGGAMAASTACETYRREVGSGHLYGAYAPSDPHGSYIAWFFAAEGKFRWQRFWSDHPLEDESWKDR